MHVLSDHQAQQLQGGFFGSSSQLGRTPRSGGHSLGRLWYSTLLSLQAVFTNVSQINFAINVALGGGTVINNQANVLSISSRF
jgi:hypothetical protein